VSGALETVADIIVSKVVDVCTSDPTSFRNSVQLPKLLFASMEAEIKSIHNSSNRPQTATGPTWGNRGCGKNQ